jgi:hypothetical protein
MSPKHIIFSVLYAGPTVKNCRTVPINVPVYWVALSRLGKRGLGAKMFIAGLSHSGLLFYM